MAGKLPTGVDPEIETRFEEINRQFQRVTMTFFTRAPLAKEIPERALVLARISGVTFIYTKVGDQISRVALTDV